MKDDGKGIMFCAILTNLSVQNIISRNPSFHLVRSDCCCCCCWMLRRTSTLFADDGKKSWEKDDETSFLEDNKNNVDKQLCCIIIRHVVMDYFIGTETLGCCDGNCRSEVFYLRQVTVALSKKLPNNFEIVHIHLVSTLNVASSFNKDNPWDNLNDENYCETFSWWWKLSQVHFIRDTLSWRIKRWP